MRKLFVSAAAVLLLASCGRSASVSPVSSLCHDGDTVVLYRLTNGRDMEIKVTNFAASLTDAVVPDSRGNRGHVVLGFDSLHLYLGKQPKLGATVGRYANRIGGAEFTIDGERFALDKNNSGNCLHGGLAGFHQQVFRVDTLYAGADAATIVFSHFSPDGEGGFPGNLSLRVAYTLTSDNEIIIDYEATTDRPTVVNFTNHTYFNLSGGRRPVLDHHFRIAADSITPTDPTGVPTGVLEAVAGTRYDFRTARQAANTVGEGYDVNYRLNKETGGLELAAVVADPISGLVLKAWTTEPGMQFYLPRKAMSGRTGHDGRQYGDFCSFCLEMQHFPDSPNHANFPSTRLNPNDIYRQRTIYRFETAAE